MITSTRKDERWWLWTSGLIAFTNTRRRSTLSPTWCPVARCASTNSTCRTRWSGILGWTRLGNWATSATTSFRTCSLWPPDTSPLQSFYCRAQLLSPAQSFKWVSLSCLCFNSNLMDLSPSPLKHDYCDTSESNPKPQEATFWKFLPIPQLVLTNFWKVNRWRVLKIAFSFIYLKTFLLWIVQPIKISKLLFIFFRLELSLIWNKTKSYCNEISWLNGVFFFGQFLDYYRRQRKQEN